LVTLVRRRWSDDDSTALMWRLETDLSAGFSVLVVAVHDLVPRVENLNVVDRCCVQQTSNFAIALSEHLKVAGLAAHCSLEAVHGLADTSTLNPRGLLREVRQSLDKVSRSVDVASALSLNWAGAENTGGGEKGDESERAHSVCDGRIPSIFNQPKTVLTESSRRHAASEKEARRPRGPWRFE
jgi:hypothetical protein